MLLLGQEIKILYSFDTAFLSPPGCDLRVKKANGMLAANAKTGGLLLNLASLHHHLRVALDMRCTCALRQRSLRHILRTSTPGYASTQLQITHPFVGLRSRCRQLQGSGSGLSLTSTTAAAGAGPMGSVRLNKIPLDSLVLGEVWFRVFALGSSHPSSRRAVLLEAGGRFLTTWDQHLLWSSR